MSKRAEYNFYLYKTKHLSLYYWDCVTSTKKRRFWSIHYKRRANALESIKRMRRDLKPGLSSFKDLTGDPTTRGVKSGKSV